MIANKAAMVFTLAVLAGTDSFAAAQATAHDPHYQDRNLWPAHASSCASDVADASE